MPRLLNRLHQTGMAALVVAVIIGGTPGRAFAQDVESRPWSEILIVVGRDIALSLPDAYVEGKATAVTTDALELDVQASSNNSKYPKGRATIARSLVSVIRMRRSDGRAPRVATQMLGTAAVFGGLAGLGSRNGVRGSLRSAGVQIGAAALGTALGRKLDDREVETVIRIVTEPAQSDAVPGRSVSVPRLP
jgi:hypothetical protein